MTKGAGGVFDLIERLEQTAVFDPEARMTGIQSEGLVVGLEGKLVSVSSSVDELFVGEGKVFPGIDVLGIEFDGGLGLCYGLLDELNDLLAV